MLGGLACAHNKANTDEGWVVAQDSTKANNDTSAYKAQPRDTMAVPTDTTPAAPTPTQPIRRRLPRLDTDPGRYDPVPAAGRADPD